MTEQGPVRSACRVVLMGGAALMALASAGAASAQQSLASIPPVPVVSAPPSDVRRNHMPSGVSKSGHPLTTMREFN